jgi:hypothetical protein
MPEMMKCFVMHGIGKVGVMDKPVPRAGPNDAIIRTPPRSFAPPTPTPWRVQSATARA